MICGYTQDSGTRIKSRTDLISTDELLQFILLINKLYFQKRIKSQLLDIIGECP